MNATVVALVLIAVPIWLLLIVWLWRTDPARPKVSRDRNGTGG
jgi:hypothetical protein